MAILTDLKAAQHINVKYICCHNVHENEVFERLCKEEGKGTKFECTTLGTQKTNGRIEPMLFFAIKCAH